jgi:prevent-host-death family protein
MTITISELGTRTEEIVREVEEGHVVEVERDGKVVARITPVAAKRVRPWEALRGSGEFLGDPEESVWDVDPNGKR